MRSNTSTAALVVAFIVLAQAAPAAAGRSHDRTGFYIGFGLGFGGAGWKTGSLLDGSTDDTGGGAVDFRLGGALRENVLLGVESSNWARSENDATLSFNAVTAAVTWFPGNVGAYLRGGFGFGSSKWEFKGVVLGVPIDVSTTDSGWAFLAAGGYEWRLSDKFALGPQVQLTYLGLDGELIDTASILDLTLQLDWYW